MVKLKAIKRVDITCPQCEALLGHCAVYYQDDFVGKGYQCICGCTSVHCEYSWYTPADKELWDHQLVLWNQWVEPVDPDSSFHQGLFLEGLAVIEGVFLSRQQLAYDIGSLLRLQEVVNGEYATWLKDIVSDLEGALDNGLIDDTNPLFSIGDNNGMV